MLKLQSKTFFVGQNLVYLPHCHSTNDLAHQISQKSDFMDGTVVITDFQTAGRGQRGTQWQSEKGKNITLSFLFDASFLTIAQQFSISKITALALRATLQQYLPNEVKIKWPNDIYVGPKKLSGVLIENSFRGNIIQSSVIGIGINLHQKVFDNARATSLILEGVNIDREPLVETLCEQLEAYWLKLKKGEDLGQEYLNHLLGYQQKRIFEVKGERFEGTISGVDEWGRLCIASTFPQKIFDIKEITFCFESED